MALSLLSPPAVEPVSVADLKSQAAIAADDDDGDLAGKITAARLLVERRRNLALITQTWTWSAPLPRDQASVPLPLAPVRTGATVSVDYRSTDGATVALDTGRWRLVASDVLPRLIPATVWPAMDRRAPDALSVAFEAGYGDAAAAVPMALRQEILIVAAALYARRESIEAPAAVLSGGFGSLVF
ncbi:MAG: hypothetical protein JNM75_06490 [Rhodospirillales bacterium]|nr:hypothetical protein [Rhodospirillales bacterium]